MKNNEKPPMYKGDSLICSKIIKKLEESGAVNTHDYYGNDEQSYYYKSLDNTIRKSDDKLLLEMFYQLKNVESKIIEYQLSAENHDRVLCRNNGFWKVVVFKNIEFLDGDMFLIDTLENRWIRFLPYCSETKKLIGGHSDPDNIYRFIQYEK